MFKDLKSRIVSTDVISQNFDASSQSLALIEAGKRIIAETAHYNGGPSRDFERVGRDSMQLLLTNGLLPSHKVLDFRCGSLRLGYWLIRFLDTGCYYGIEPVEKGVRAGLKHLIRSELETFKQPSFRFVADNKMDAFGVSFDYVIARSILTHTCPGMLRAVLKSFASTCPDGIFLASYWRSDGDVVLSSKSVDPERISAQARNLESDDMRFIGYIFYTLDEMQEIAAECGLLVEEDRTYKPINSQLWLRFTNKKRGKLA